MKEAIKTGHWYKPAVKIFEKCKLEFTEQNGVIIKGNRIVIPSKLRSEIIEIVHQGHIGISKAKAALREKVYWPGIDKEVEEQFGNCLA